MRQEFVISVNPEPWATPPYSPGRSKKSGKLFVRAGRNEQLYAFQQEVKEQLIDQGAQMDSGPYKIEFWFWRNLGKNNNDADVTNMQKACEDALHSVIINNDKFTKVIHGNSVEQGALAPGMIAIAVTGEYTQCDPIPPSMIARVDRMYNMIKQGINNNTYDEFNLDNTWP